MRLIDELAFMQRLKGENYIDPRPIGNGRWAALFEFMFTWAIIVGRIGDGDGYDDRWCYHSKAAVIAAFEAWDGQGEPEGWHRHPLSGRRRGKDGSEEVRW